MKRVILALAFLLALTSGINAQITVQHDTVGATYYGSALNIHNPISTTSTTPVVVRWSVTNHNLPADWMNFDLGICDNQLCYGSNIFNGSTTQIDTAKNNKPIDLKLAINPGVTNGSFFVSVNIRDGVSTNKNVVFIINKWPTGVTTISKVEDDVTLYPNPANDNVNIVFDGGLNVKNVMVYNLIGKPVKVFKVSGNSAKLDINDVPSGIYFVRLLNAQGQIVATRKFTHY
ncbi:MAG: T9SS type A sorting domain-containing protein [Bacteroidetes bacterium]|nr:T9SS type A sorting domain-containing protein [Bacteroidota bacterium]